ncbi:MAG: mannose-1-phosphate guanylyltransferase [Aestuariivirga sp.]
MSIVPVILCGGSGTRLWPLSRAERPKQLISFTGNNTLLEETLNRARMISGAGQIICVLAAPHELDVRKSLKRLGMRGTLLLEPAPRNTAPALTAAAIVASRNNPDAIIVALPADHVIEDGEIFTASIACACAAADAGLLTVLGVRPRYPSTALGYIVPGASIDGLSRVHRVDRFVEKPSQDAAETLIAEGALWNAGIVVARASAVVVAMRQHEPAVLQAVECSLANGDSEGGDVRPALSDFGRAARISFDNAVLEKHRGVAVTPFDAGWRDIGTWTEVAELYPADADENRRHGTVSLSSSRDTFVFSPNRLTVGIGLKDLIIVDTPDALLIVDLKSIGNFRKVMEDVIARYPEAAKSDQAIEARTILLNPGQIFQYETGHDSTRHWIVTQGEVTVSIGGRASIYKINERFREILDDAFVIRNSGSAPAKLIEVLVAPDTRLTSQYF